MIEIFVQTRKGVDIPLARYVDFIKSGKAWNDAIDRRAAESGKRFSGPDEKGPEAAGYQGVKGIS